MKRALVISANSGLGECICIDLLKRGYDLDVTFRNIDENQSLVSKFNELGNGKVTAFHFDATKKESSRLLLEQIQRPDLAIICTGILGDHEKALEDDHEIIRIIETNFSGLAILIRGLAKKMEKSGGIIAGISSVAGERGRRGNFVYGSSKKALTTFLDGYRHLYHGSKLKFVTVIPGYIKTRMLTDKTPGFLTSTPENAAKEIVGKTLAGKSKFYVGPIWYWVMMVIRNLPEFIFMRMKI